MPTSTQLSLNGPMLSPRSGNVKRLILILHGYGADGDNLLGVAQMMAAEFPDTLWFAPNAPESCEMGMGYQWFSLADRSMPARDKGVKSAAAIVTTALDYLKQEYQITDPDIALLGFSQGTMTSIYTALRLPQPIAGVVGFSGALLGESTMKDELLSKPEMCLIHGDSDEVVPYAALEHARAGLKSIGVSVESHSRANLGHSIDEKGIEIASAFLRKQFKL